MEQRPVERPTSSRQTSVGRIWQQAAIPTTHKGGAMPQDATTWQRLASCAQHHACVLDTTLPPSFNEAAFVTGSPDYIKA